MNYFRVLVGVAAEQILLDSEHDRGDDACYRRCVGMHGLAAGAGPTRMLSAALIGFKKVILVTWLQFL
jgi:hypothetical protein